MPQLDTSSYSLQLFWLVVTFSLLYLFVSRVFLPAMSGVIKHRSSKVAMDIAEAEKAIENHKVLKSEIDIILSDARSRALGLKADMTLEAKRVVDLELKEFEVDLEKRTAEEVKRLEAVKLQMKSELPHTVKDLSDEIFKTVLDGFQNKSQKMN